jgi:hypothetical protein
MSKTLLRLVLAMATIVLLLILWSSWPGFEPSVHVPATADQGQARQAVAAAQAGATTPAAASPGDAAVERIAVDADAGADAAQETLLPIRVVDAVTGAPVAHATVSWLRPDASAQLARLPEPERSQLQYDERQSTALYGSSATSDAQGWVQVRLSPMSRTVYGWADSRCGKMFVPREEPPAGGWLLKLEHELLVHARVRNERDEPCQGVAVEVRGSDAKGQRVPMWQPRPRLTDAEGKVSFHHMQSWLREIEKKVQVVRWELALAVPGLEEAGVAFDPNQPPTDPVELRLPATGALLARVVHEGKAYTHQVILIVLRVGGERGDGLDRALGVSPGSDGYARLAPVALGGELLVHANFRYGSYLQKIVAAPQSAGETVRVDLETGNMVMLSGQVFRPDGTLARNSMLAAYFNAASSSGSTMVETDAEGRFLWFVSSQYQSGARLSNLVLTWMQQHQTTLRCVVAPRDLVRGVNDLGPLTLSAGPLVVAGRIESDAAQPGKQWEIQIDVLDTSGANAAGERWVRLHGLVHSALSDGRFEFRGEAKPTRHRLRVVDPSHLPVEPIEFQPGAADLQIHVSMGHSLAMKVQLPETSMGNRFVARLRPRFAPPAEAAGPEGQTSEDRYSASPWGATAEPNTRRWAGLPAGTYDLDFQLHGFDELLLHIPAVEVPPPPGGDARLQGIDLRDRLNIVRLSVEFANLHPGQRLPTSVRVFPQPQRDASHWRGLSVSPGSLLPMLAGTQELLLCQEGFMPVRASVDGPELAVVMSPWPKIALEFTVPPTLPDGVDLYLSAAAEAAEDDNKQYTLFRDSEPLQDLLHPEVEDAKVEGGVAGLILGDLSYRLNAYVVDRRRSPSRREVLQTLEPQWLPAGRKQGPIMVSLPAAHLAAVLARLAGER